MAIKAQSKLSGYLLIAAGIMFFVASLSSGQSTFTVLGIVFVILGIAALRKVTLSDRHHTPPSS